MREIKGCWTDLFHTFMIALDFRKLSIAFVGLALSAVVTLLPIFALGWAQFREAGSPIGVTMEEGTAGAAGAPMEMKQNVQVSLSSGDINAIFAVGWRTAFPGVRVTGVERALTASRLKDRAAGLCDFFSSCVERGEVESGKQEKPLRFLWVFPVTVTQRMARWGSFTFFLLLLSLIWAKFGGAITRIAAVEIAKDEVIETQKALEYSSNKYGHYFWAPLICAGFFLFFFLCVAIVAFLGRLPWLNVLAMLGFPLALLSGFVMMMIAVGTAFSLPLFYPAISAEGTDSFDAISRGFSYFFSRPAHYAGYQIVAFLFGIVSWAIVRFLGWLVLKCTFAAGRISFGKYRGFDFDYLFTGIWAGTPYSLRELLQINTSVGLSAVLFNAWLTIFVGMIAAYAVAYFFSAQTMIYFLLRKQVDSIDVTEVFEEPEEEPAPPPAPAAPAPATAPKPA